MSINYNGLSHLLFLKHILDFPGGLVVKNQPTKQKTHLSMQEMQKTGDWSLGQEDTLDECMETHASILTWRMFGLMSLGG